MAGNGPRDHVGRFASGHPGGPGRPRNGVRTALARLVDFDAIAAYVYSVALDDEADPKDRQWAIGFIADRLEGRAVQAVSMGVQLATSAALPSNWAAMTEADRDAWLDAVGAGTLALAQAIEVEP